MINYYNLMKQFIQHYQQIIHEQEPNIAIALSPAMQHAKEITPYRELWKLSLGLDTYGN
jgi:hypothetical protein